MWFRSRIRQFLRKTGYDIIMFHSATSPIVRRMQLIKHNSIDLILDVGANIGQYAVGMRENRYKGRIVSFEPLSSAFAELKKRARNDPTWDVVNIALGSQNARAKINIAENSESSSLLDMLPRLVKMAPYAAYIDSEEITVRTLDSIFHEYYHLGERAYLKIDTQGYEKNVIEGACQALENIIGIQMEMSLVPLYENEVLFTTMIDYMSEKGYTLMSIEPVFSDPVTGQLLQIDGIFFRQ